MRYEGEKFYHQCLNPNSGAYLPLGDVHRLDDILVIPIALFVKA